MRKILAILMALAIVMPTALALIETGIDTGIVIDTEDFKPLVWMCDGRQVLDDHTSPGRITGADDVMIERTQNYAFEGEQVTWNVLVMDKNGIGKVKDVYVSVGSVQGTGQAIEANCQEDPSITTEAMIQEFRSCNARIGEELVSLDPSIMGFYKCKLTVETPASMHGQYWVTANAVDLDDQVGTFAENEYWFFNPTVALTFSGLPVNFGTVRPGTTAYSRTITIGNGAEPGSGVMLDMFITGTDFYDAAHTGAMCPNTNQLSLANFRYFASNGAYSTLNDARKDVEGYVGIGYGALFNNPTKFYGRAEIIRTALNSLGYSVGNVLAPGAEMAITFKLNLPEPCNGDFSDGHIYFWGEAI